MLNRILLSIIVFGLIVLVLIPADYQSPYEKCLDRSVKYLNTHKTVSEIPQRFVVSQCKLNSDFNPETMELPKK